MAPVQAVEPVHGALTYPMYARQLAGRLAARDWVAFEARVGQRLIGLVIAARGATRAELLSVAVSKFDRRQGVASRLLETLRESMLAAGAGALTVAFRHDLGNVEAVKALLVRNGWSEPATITEIGSIESGEQTVRAESCAARYPVSFGARVTAWRETTPAQRQELEDGTWYPRNLAPSRFLEPGEENAISSAVLAENRIIGWMLVRVGMMDPPPADFLCAYVHPAWQRRGTFMWLLARCARELRVRHERYVASWTVADQRPETRRFVRRRLSPFGARFGLMVTSHAPGFPKAE